MARSQREGKIWTNCSPLAVSLAHISVLRPKNLNSWNRLTIVRILKAVSFASCPNILLVFKDCAVSFTALQLRVNPQTVWQIIGISVKSSTLNRANNNLKYVPNLSSLTTLKVPGGLLGFIFTGYVPLKLVSLLEKSRSTSGEFV